MRLWRGAGGHGRGRRQGAEPLPHPWLSLDLSVYFRPSCTPPMGRTSSFSQSSHQNPVQSHSDYHCQWKCLLLMGWANSRENQWCGWGDLGQKFLISLLFHEWVWRIHVFPSFVQTWFCSAAGVSRYGANPQQWEALRGLSPSERMLSHAEILSSPVLPPLQSSVNTAFAPMDFPEQRFFHISGKIQWAVSKAREVQRPRSLLMW